MWSDLDVCVLDIHTSMHLLSSLKTPPHCRWNGWAYLEEIAGWVTSSWLTNTSHWASNLMNQWSIVIFLWFSYFHIIISSRCHGILGYILLPILRELHLCFSKSPFLQGICLNKAWQRLDDWLKRLVRLVRLVRDFKSWNFIKSMNGFGCLSSSSCPRCIFSLFDHLVLLVEQDSFHSNWT